jgi:hypothetical protein
MLCYVNGCGCCRIPSPRRTANSTTQVLDRPVHGRLFFEQVIRENLDLGRPEEIKLIFDRRIPHRRRRRERFCTRIVTRDVTPALQEHAHQAVPQGKPGLTHRDDPHGGAARACRALPGLRLHDHCIQQLP